MDQAVTRRRGRRRLLLLVLLFAAPLAAAFFLYYAAPASWIPQGRSNSGHLLQPARPLTDLTLHALDGSLLDQGVFRERWTLLLVGAPTCDEACSKTLYDTRQVRTALGRNTLRVQRIYVAIGRSGIESLQALQGREHPDLKLLVAEGAEVHALQRFFSADGRTPQAPGGDVYLLDPLGNWLMYYTPQDPPKGMLKDLKKLLKLSSIG